jgi:hypothetical protein
MSKNKSIVQKQREIRARRARGYLYTKLGIPLEEKSPLQWPTASYLKILKLLQSNNEQH